MGSVQLTYVGHQTWLVEGGGRAVLVDPVLEEAFGLGDAFRVWPPRAVDTGSMPRVDAVVLTHEHLDHFHPASLDRLERSVPVFTGPMLPAAVEDAITALGFTVRRINHRGVISYGDLTIRLYPAGGKTLFWENRVVQPVIQCGDGPSVFIGVDADLSDEYVADIAQGLQPMPALAVVSNNSQISPPGTLGSDTNLLPGAGGDTRRRHNGLSVLQQLLLDYPERLDGVTDIALCGNGFVPPHTPHGPYLYADHPVLAAAANQLQHLFTVHGPRPGHRLTVPAQGPVTCDQVDWITPDTATEAAWRQAHADYLAHPTPPVPQPIAPPVGDEQQALTDLDAALVRLGQDLVPTPAGQLAASLHDYLSGPLGAHRMSLTLLDAPSGGDLHYAWDVTTAAFAPAEPLTLDEAMAAYPFGMRMYFQDLVGLVRGDVQVWDIALASMQVWNLGRPLDSLVYALFQIYGEHQRPDLAARSYARMLAALPVRV